MAPIMNKSCIVFASGHPRSFQKLFFHEGTQNMYKCNEICSVALFGVLIGVQSSRSELWPTLSLVIINSVVILMLVIVLKANLTSVN